MYPSQKDSNDNRSVMNHFLNHSSAFRNSNHSPFTNLNSMQPKMIERPTMTRFLTKSTLDSQKEDTLFNDRSNKKYVYFFFFLLYKNNSYCF
jgi:hypothetical protein